MKRNLLKKACCFLVVAVIATGAVSGCARGIANDENTLEISVFDGGWGTEYMYELKDAFKAVHPEIDVVITEEQLLGKTDATLRTDATTTDLYFSTDNVYGLMFGEGSILEGYDMIFEPLDEVYDYKPDGGEKTVRELTPAQELNHATYTYMKGNDEITHEYFIYPTGGFSGFIYNATKFEELNLTIPRTTDELYNVTCQQIKDKFTTQSRDKAAFSVSVKTAYSEYMVDVWWAQYETVKGQEDFCNGVYYENGVRKTGPKIFEEESRLYALQAYEKMINPEYGNSHANINTMTYMQAQQQFMLGNCLMMINGSWLENEMKGKTDNDYVFKVMKTPIISKIIDKTPTINDDAKLCEVIDYVDGVTAEKPAGVSDEDIETIRTARSVIYGSLASGVFIPSFATAKAAAKEFLKFCTTKRAGQIIFDKTGGNLPIYSADKIDTSNASEFIKSTIDPIITGTRTFCSYRSRLFAMGGMLVFPGTTGITSKFAANNPNDRLTAQYIFDNAKKIADQSYFDGVLRTAGVI